MIIDFHAHVFPDKIARRTVEALAERGQIESFSDGTVAALNERLSSADVSLAVNLPAITKPEQFDSVLNFALELNSASQEDGKILSFAGIHPDCDEIEEKMSRIRTLGFKGVKIHPDYQGHFIDDEGYVRIIGAAKREGLIVVTHAGFDVAFPDEPMKCTPKRVLKLLDKIGGYDKLVLAHLGGNQLLDDVYDNLCGEDVYFDTGYVLEDVTQNDFARILEKHTEDRILFGTDSPWRDVQKQVSIIKDYRLGDKAEYKIFYENARELLGL